MSKKGFVKAGLVDPGCMFFEAYKNQRIRCADDSTIKQIS